MVRSAGASTSSLERVSRCAPGKRVLLDLRAHHHERAVGVGDGSRGLVVGNGNVVSHGAAARTLGIEEAREIHARGHAALAAVIGDVEADRRGDQASVGGDAREHVFAGDGAGRDQGGALDHGLFEHEPGLAILGSGRSVDANHAVVRERGHVRLMRVGEQGSHGRSSGDRGGLLDVCVREQGQDFDDQKREDAGECRHDGDPARAHDPDRRAVREKPAPTGRGRTNPQVDRGVFRRRILGKGLGAQFRFSSAWRVLRSRCPQGAAGSRP